MFSIGKGVEFVKVVVPISHLEINPIPVLKSTKQVDKSSEAARTTPSTIAISVPFTPL